MFFSIKDKKPQIGENVFIAPNATIIGDVVIEEGSSIWFNVVIRGDVSPIRIGKECNIQDGTIIHGTQGRCGVHLANRVSIGHGAILHGCDIDEGSLIGMGSILLDLVKIGKNCLVGAGSLVTEKSVFEDGQLILGSPAKVKRQLSHEQIKEIQSTADKYMEYKTWYKAVH